MKVLKIIGIIIGSFIGVFALMFFLYPYINQEHYEELMQSNDTAGDFLMADGMMSEEEYEELQEELQQLRVENNELQESVDSLEQLNEDLGLEIHEWENMEDFMPVAGSPDEPVQQGSSFYMDDEEFGERVKSLLNLDEEELRPIVSEMDDGQLVRLYQSGGTIQREKLLRSLSPQRAADLMSEVML